MEGATPEFFSGERAGQPARRHGPLRLLLLAGTAEARQIAYALARDPSVVTTASLARPGRRLMPLGIPTRIGGWGGREPFRDWVVENRITGIIDATHPFAADISLRAASVAAELRIDYIQFLRAAWRPDEGDNWTFLNREEDAANHVPEGAKVFLATGRKRLSSFADMKGRYFVCRIVDGPASAFPFTHGRFLLQRPPFSLEDEIKTLSELGIDWLVARNSGGSGSRAKIDAARAVGLPVAMIRRPPRQEAARAETVSEVLNWVRRRV